MSLGGDLTIANQSVPGVVGSLTISGSGSSLMQYQNSAITVGCVGNGTASITISNAGLLETGTGLLNISDTGTVTVNATGTLNANGDVLIDGGVLTVGGNFNWENDRTMTIIHDASATFSATYTTPSNGTINVNGFNSLFQMTGSLADLNIVNGTTMNIGAQASLYVADIISVGTTGNGILNVDGIGAKAIAGSTTTVSVFGDNGGIASVTFSNQANGSFNFGSESGGRLK